MSGEGVLVTGGAGFIGSHLVDLLVEKGHAVYVLDDLSSGRMENLSMHEGSDAIRFIKGDVSRPMDECLNPGSMKGGPEIGAIFHLAARVDVTTSISNPLDDARVNYIGTLNVLDFALRNGVENMIFSSSAAVYGDVKEIPTPEDAPKSPISPYGSHKLASENILGMFNEHYGMRCTALRFFNVYGPRQDPSNPYSGVISKFIDASLRKDPLIIFGDGNQSRDFVYVRDVAEALYRAYLRSPSMVLNIGTGRETTVNSLAKTVIRTSGYDGRTVHMPERKGEIIRSCARISMAREHLDLTADTDIQQGVVETMRWFRTMR